jgi:ribosomal protein S18 acetylase RimI-like enzyme
MLTTKIRVARESELDSLVARIKEYYAYDRHNFDANVARRAMSKLLKDHHLGTVLLVIDDKKIVGYLVLALGYSLEFGGRDAFIDEFFILEQYRGKGLGRTALRQAEKAARKLGVKAIHLEVTRHNSAVIDLYKRDGFVDHDRYLMTKRIQSH